MKLDMAQVRHVAKLARLQLSDAEEIAAQSQLSAILDAMDELAAFDSVKATSVQKDIAASSTDHLRADEVADQLGADEALSNAPRKYEASFAVPRVIE